MLYSELSSSPIGKIYLSIWWFLLDYINFGHALIWSKAFFQIIFKSESDFQQVFANLTFFKIVWKTLGFLAQTIYIYLILSIYIFFANTGKRMVFLIGFSLITIISFVSYLGYSYYKKVDNQNKTQQYQEIFEKTGRIEKWMVWEIRDLYEINFPKWWIRPIKDVTSLQVTSFNAGNTSKNYDRLWWSDTFSSPDDVQKKNWLTVIVCRGEVECKIETEKVLISGDNKTKTTLDGIPAYKIYHSKTKNKYEIVTIEPVRNTFYGLTKNTFYSISYENDAKNQPIIDAMISSFKIKR